MKLILLGAPGAGKGTQAEIICERLGIPAISTGNIIREALRNGTEMGLRAKSYMESGALVPDDVVIGIIKERLAADDCKNGFILDGFPRTVPQAEALDQIARIDCALSLEVPDEVIEGRMTGRRVCLKCGATYHIKANPPKVENTCDNCGDRLHIRKDDKPDVVQHRLATYHEQTEPLKEYYGKQGKVKSIDGTQGIHQTEQFAVEALGL